MIDKITSTVKAVIMAFFDFNKSSSPKPDEPKKADAIRITANFFNKQKSSSKRYYQLSFQGFIPQGENALQKLFNTWKTFFKDLNYYFWEKIGDIAALILNVLMFLFDIPNRVKSFVVKKLIWSRGKLGRTIATWTVMGFAFTSFMFGEVLSNSDLVIDKNSESDYVTSSVAIIPKKEIALTTIPAARQNVDSFSYGVQSGDTLYSIGTKFKISIDALKYVNSLTDNSILKVGQEIIIPPVSGLVHKVENGDTLSSIARQYDVPPQAVADFNYLLDTSKLAVGTELVIPGAKVPQRIQIPTPIYAAPSLGSSGNAPANGSLCVWPSTVRIITQYFTWYHNGVDIAAARGTAMPPLLACTSGVVTRSGWDPFGLGLHVRIDHGNGFETVYGHMSRIDVSYGEEVSQGEIIGLMGNTGRSTGPHVHFMVNYNGGSQNPLNYMN